MQPSGATMTSPESGPVVIACGADDRYVQPLAVMVCSVLANLSAGRAVVVYILDGGIAPAGKARLLESWSGAPVTPHWLPVRASRFSGLPLWGRMPVSTYLKLLVPELVPDHVERAIWLDCDLVALGDLSHLWASESEGRHLLAAQDQIVPFVSSRDGVAGYRELGLPTDAKYFNAGVMVIDLALWRRDDIAGRVFDHLRRYRERVTFWDQEGLNAVLSGQWGELDPRWNYNVSAGVHRSRGKRRRTPDDEPWIVHFTGNLKPWVYQGRNPYYARYFQYLDRTAWAGWRPEPTIRGRLAGLYEGSGLRGVLYPAESWGMHLFRAATRRYTPESVG
jgi:lipopolysaccharide biosynthesis glycosyltransferase